MERQSEQLRPKGSVAERIRRKLDHVFHPASSASEEAFRSIIAVLPEGDMKRSMETVVPQLKDLLKVQDRELAIGSFMQRAISSVVFGVFGGVAGGAVGTAVGFGVNFPLSLYGIAAGAASGVGLAFGTPTVAQAERSRIAIAAKQQEMMLRTSGGKEAAKVFDAKRVDQITQAILWGTGAHGGPGGVLSQAANPTA